MEKEKKNRDFTIKKLKPLGTIIPPDGPVKFLDDCTYSDLAGGFYFNYDSPEGASQFVERSELEWWKEQLFYIIRFDDSTVIERIKIILGESAWNKIEKEYEKWKKN